MPHKDLSDVPHEHLVDRAKGCLLGGAIGDALGAPVEFMSLDDIRHKYGEDGIQELDTAYGVLGTITDDTQMTLFSAEGLIRAQVRYAHRGICSPETVVAYAYQRWLATQGELCNPFAVSEVARGWLCDVPELRSRRAPGMTCLSALRVWDQNEAQNSSKGCGTVMRSAPFGFVESSSDLAASCARITHGHIEGEASASIFAQAIRRLVLGHSLEESLTGSFDGYEDSDSARLVRMAIALARSGSSPIDAIRELGQGWTADEALAVGVYAALQAGSNFVRGILFAVNHDGDSDSTGSICGSLIGAQFGMPCLPPEMLSQLELRDVIEQVAEDLVTPNSELTNAEFNARYPGC